MLYKDSLKTSLGIPYMGSKRKLAPKIINKILLDNPNTKYFYDLFGGGGSMSLYVNQIKDIEVHYNELNTSIVMLLEKILKDGVTKEFYDFVDRERFNEIKNFEEPSYIKGLINSCYSFGNNVQKGYMYGKDIEEDKHLLHNIIINLDKKALEDFNNRNNLNLDIKHIECMRELDYYNRRLYIRDKIIEQGVERLDIQHLEGIQHLDLIHNNNTKKINITNLSFEDVEINTPIENTIIYLDPPYKGTATYQKDTSHNIIKDYIKKSPYTIYVSGYENVYDLDLALEIKHNTSLSQNNKEVIEKLYVHNKRDFYEEW